MKPAASVSDNVAKEILQDHQTWLPEGFVCRGDLNKYRSRYVHSLLLSEKGDVTALEEEIVSSLRDHDILSKHVEAEFDQQWSFGERLADKIATFGGSHQWERLAQIQEVQLDVLSEITRQSED